MVPILITEAITVVLAMWWLTHVWKRRMQPGEYFCMVTRVPFGRRLWHFHRPSEDIVNCERSKTRSIK